jgi:hypothetical protein
LSEIDFDDLYERSKDALDANWPTSSTMTDAERKAGMIAIIESGVNNEWPGLNLHAPNDRYILIKTENIETGETMGLATGFILEDGTFDGRHMFSAPDQNGSRNYIYAEENRIERNNLNIQLGVDKILYRVPENSIMHRILRQRENTGNYEILEDIESPTLGPGHRNVKILLNL